MRNARRHPTFVVTAFTLLLALAAVYGLARDTTFASHAVGVEISPTSVPVAQGASTIVDVVATTPAALGLGAWGVDVTYNNAVLTATACTASVPDAEVSTCNKAYNATTVRLGGAASGGLPATGTAVILARITFQAIGAAGTSSPLTVNITRFATPAEVEIQPRTATNGQITIPSLPATKLAITQIDPASPTAGQPFSVTVQAQDSAATPANVAAATLVTLSRKTGTGNLGGTLTGTIAQGTNSITISGVTYSVAETGVVLTAAATNGDALSAGDSGLFAVVAPATVQFSQASYSVNEGAGTVTLTVTRTGNTAGTATVRYTTTGQTATHLEDYTGGTDYVTFGAGVTTETIAIPIVNDSLIESDETFTVWLEGMNGVILGTPSTATVTIVDDDNPGVVQFSQASYSVNEGAGSVTLGLTRTGGNTARTATVRYNLSDQTATHLEDYTGGTDYVTFDAGVTTQTIVIPIVNDSATESDETFTVWLEGMNGVILGTPGTATVTIVDNDPARTADALAVTSVSPSPVISGRVVGSYGAAGMDSFAIGPIPASGTFDVTVQAQDSTGAPANVVTAATVTLFVKTGTGTLGGVFSGIIAANTHTTTITGVSYSKPENGVVLRVDDDPYPNETTETGLRPGDSSPFDVVASQVGVKIDPALVSVPPGGSTTVDVVATAPAALGLGAWGVDVTYNNAVLTATACTASVPDAEVSTCNKAYNATTVRLGGAASGGLPATGTAVILARITFQAIGTPGTSSPLTVNITRFATPAEVEIQPRTATNGLISVVSTSLPPTKLAITQVSPASPTVGQGFSVTVESRDANNAPANVAAATPVHLTRKTGTGALGGTLTNTIAQGTNSITISGVTYSVAETGVVLRADDDAAPNETTETGLIPGDSAPFSVVAAPVPAITLSPTSGLPGTNVTVSGTGFVASENVMIHWDGLGHSSTACDPAGTMLTQAPSNAAGAFTTVVTVPACAALGGHDVLAVGAQTATAVFAVSATVHLSLDPTPAIVGVNGTIDVAIHVESGAQLVDGVEAVLSFDPARLEVVDADSAVSGVQLTLGNCALPTLVTNEVDNANGTIHLARGATSGTPQPILASCTLGTIRFRGKVEAPDGVPVPFVRPPAFPAIAASYNQNDLEVSATDGLVKIVGKVLAFTSQPVRGAHTFPLGIQPVVAVQQAGVTITSDSTTVVTLRIKPGTGTPGATLSCGPQGLSRTVSGGVASWADTNDPTNGCKIDLKGEGYVLEATATGASAGSTTAFPIGWAGDANGNCKVDIVDFSVLAYGFGRHLGDAGFDPRPDMNGDNKVDTLDFSILTTLFGTRCPTLGLSSTSAAAGTQLTVTGSAYVAYRDVTVTFDGVAVSTTPTPLVGSASGGFSASFTVPAGTPAGTHVVKASQKDGRVVAAAIVTVP